MVAGAAHPPARIATDRLVLRPWQIADADLLQAALTESVEHLLPWVPWATPAPPTDAETDERLLRWIADFDAGINWVYALWDRDEQDVIGGAGLYGRVGPGALEIGYWIRRSQSGKGFATESSRALTAVGFALPDVERLEMHCDAKNTASRRVPEKLGYRERETRDEGRDIVVYELAREG